MKSLRTTSIVCQVAPEEIQEECERFLESKVFAHSHQLQKLLAFMVRHSLLNNHHRITQAVIAREVLETGDFDSVFDSSVRRLAARLRERLRDYYGSEGRDDAVVIMFPKGQPYRLIATHRHSIETAHPLDDRAFEEYQRGRSLWAMRTPESLHAAMDCFKRAIELFPGYSLAHSALGECYSFMAIWGAPPKEVMPSAKTHALRALEIDDNNPEAHALLGAVLYAYDWDWASAAREFERALALDDKSPGTYCWYASYLISLGRYREAAHTVHLAQATESLVASVLVNSHAAKILLVAGCYEEAASLLMRMRDESPAFYLTYFYLGILDGIVGKAYRPAIESLLKAADLSNQNSSVLSVLGSVHAKAGHVSDAESTLSILLGRRQEMYVPATDLAPLYWALGQSDEAFECLERAFEERCLFLSWLASWPPLKDLSHDPRSKAILYRLGLSE